MPLFDVACLDDLFAGRALPLLYALFNADPDSQAWVLLAALLGVALALALSVWRTERMFTPSPVITGLDAALCILANATLLFHKAHRLDRDMGVSLSAIPLYVSIILLSEMECTDRLRYIALASVLLVMLPMLVFFSIAEDLPPPNIAPPSSYWTYLFVCLTTAYAASSSPCLHVQGVAMRGATLMAIAALATHSITSLIVDRVGHGALFVTQMAFVVMPSTFIHAKTLRATLGSSTRPLMLAVAVILAGAYDSPVRFHAPAVHQPCSWAVAVLIAAAAVDATFPQ